MPKTEKNMKWAGKISWAVFYLGLWEVMLAAQNPGLMTDDSGEIAASASCLGIGHAPAFPLYVLLARLAGFFPIGAPAFRLNLLAAFFTVLAVHFTLAACRELAKRHLPKASPVPLQVELWLAFTALSLVFCESVFAQSLTAKGGIYTLTLLGAAVMLWACAREARESTAAWALFIWAVGMGNHWPFQVFWLILLAFRFGPSIRRWGRVRVLAAFSFLLIGFSTFLYIPLRAAKSPAMNWENPVTLSSFISVFLRTSATAREFAHRSIGEYAKNLLEYLQVMGWHWWPGFALLAVAGLWLLFRRSWDFALAMILAYALLVAAIVRMTHCDSATLYLQANFLVTTQAVPAVLGFAGALAIFGRWTVSRPKVSLAAALVFVLAAASWGVLVFNRQDKSRYTLAEDLGTNLLKELPQDAVVLLDADVISMPALYQRYAQGLRPDLTLVFMPLLSAKWGFIQAFSEYQGRFTASGPVQGFQEAVRLFMDPGRIRCSGVFYAYYKMTLEGAGLSDLANKLLPWGVSYRLNEGETQPLRVSSDVWNIASRRRLRHLEGAKNLPQTEFTCNVYRNNYARGHGEAEKLLLEHGLLNPAARHAQKALEVFPAMSGVYYNLAAYFKRTGYPEMSDVFLQREIEAVPEAAEGKAAALRYLTRPPPSRVSVKRSAEDYLALKKQYERDGEPWLAAAAGEAARASQAVIK